MFGQVFNFVSGVHTFNLYPDDIVETGQEV